MKINANFLLPQSLEDAKIIQDELRKKVITEDQLEKVDYVAGVDVGFEDNYQLTKAAVIVLSFPELKLVESQTAVISTTFPYVPGFLSFREIPALLKALEKLKTIPNIILCDGQGIAHPRRLGIASHLGVLIDVPTIGVAKSLFIGKHEEIPLEKGSWKPLIDQGEVIGAVLRSRTNVKPIYVSIGHKISLPTALNYVMGCLTKYRLPETTRLADKLASEKA
ncbi:deoxyribonuclease V [Aphanothece sacrum]|uniref:Endonuclease V n=1 Tax=Aphanothece sacrum FPU1 TaxID=1920663 RepID=A0A401IET4_APHSA|nr:deoxyribonuclease V [Aphanothece sacrum]GBF79736.1 endonuclease V [Aphanothece sacrum FPU1]GBF85732.1 endonuclease V [Aphanothece sacrum FPU3]